MPLNADYMDTSQANTFWEVLKTMSSSKKMSCKQTLHQLPIMASGSRPALIAHRQLKPKSQSASLFRKDRPKWSETQLLKSASNLLNTFIVHPLLQHRPSTLWLMSYTADAAPDRAYKRVKNWEMISESSCRTATLIPFGSSEDVLLLLMTIGSLSPLRAFPPREA